MVNVVCLWLKKKLDGSRLHLWKQWCEDVSKHWCLNNDNQAGRKCWLVAWSLQMVICCVSFFSHYGLKSMLQGELHRALQMLPLLKVSDLRGTKVSGESWTISVWTWQGGPHTQSSPMLMHAFCIPDLGSSFASWILLFSYSGISS